MRPVLATVLAAVAALAGSPAIAAGPHFQPADVSPTGYLHLTEISTSGAAFESWGATDIVGLHSRIQVEVALPKHDLERRIEAIEAGSASEGTGQGLTEAASRLDMALAAMTGAIRGALARPGVAVGMPLPMAVDRALEPRAFPMPSPGSRVQHPLMGFAFDGAVQRVRSLLTSAPAQHYRVIVRARLQTPVRDGGQGDKGDRREWTLTPSDAAPAWVVPRHAAIGPQARLQLRDALGLDRNAEWPRAMAELREAIANTGDTARRDALRGMLADAEAIAAKLRPLALQLEAAERDEVPAYDGYGDVPHLATLDLDALEGRRPGQHLVFQLVLQQGDAGDDDDHDVALLDERSVVINRVGLYSSVKVGLDAFNTPNYDPASTNPQLAAPVAFAPTVSFLAKWGYRTGFTDSNVSMFGSQKRLRGIMSGGAVVWNDTWNPGLGLDVSFPGLLTGHNLVPGVGLSVSVFNDLIHVGRGYDFGSGQFYWFGGIGIPWSVGDLLGE